MKKYLEVSNKWIKLKEKGIKAPKARKFPRCRVEMADQRGVNSPFLKLIASTNQNKCRIKTIGLAKTTPLYLSYQAP